MSLGSALAVLGMFLLSIFISHESDRMQQQFVSNYISQTNVLAQLSAEYVHYNNPAILTLGTLARLKQDFNIVMARFTNIDGIIVSSFAEAEVGLLRNNISDKKLRPVEVMTNDILLDEKNIVESKSSSEIRFKQQLKAWNQPMGWIEIDVTLSHLNASIQKLKLTFASIAGLIMLTFLLALWAVTRILFNPLKTLSRNLNLLSEKTASDISFRAKLEKFDILKIKTPFSEFGGFLNSFLLLKNELTESFLKLNLANEELQIKNQKLSQFDKLRDEVLASTSHELRTPLHGIMGMTEVLLNDSNHPLAEIQRQSLDLIHKCAKGLTKLTTESLNAAAIRSGKIDIQLSDFSIYQMGLDLLLLFAKQAQLKNIELINHIKPDFEQVSADYDKTFQILVNLVANALKFTSKGYIVISADILENKACISVSDTGIGISNSSLDFIFEPFAQEKTNVNSPEKGVGLGLAISRILARKQNGDLFAQSILGTGSTFTLSLNLENDGKTAPSADLKKSDYNEFKKPTLHTLNEHFKILAVDDEPLNLKILERFLSRKKEYQFYSAPNVTAGLLLFSQINPDIVLVDVRMPDISGLEMCKELRKKYSLSDLPILFLTASNSDEDIQSCHNAGGSDFISKPISMTELLTRVEIHLKLKRSTVSTTAENQNQFALISQPTTSSWQHVS